jgi:hypothetical protein
MQRQLYPRVWERIAYVIYYLTFQALNSLSTLTYVLVYTITYTLTYVRDRLSITYTLTYVRDRLGEKDSLSHTSSSLTNPSEEAKGMCTNRVQIPSTILC